MAEYEELKLAVVLTDNATAGLTAIRQQITLLTQTGSQATQSLNQVAESAKRVGDSARGATPHIASADRALKDLGRSVEGTTRGLFQMALAAKGGLGALPQLALGFREAQQGIVGVGESLAVLAPASRVAALALGGVALGVGVVGAAVTAYFVSVFKFAKEMKELGDTAKVVGSTFSELKSAQDQARKFGIAAEMITQSFASIQKAQVDLVQGGSPLRRQLLAIGTPMEVIEALTKAPDQRTFQNIAVDWAKRIEQGFLREGKTKSVARGFANKFLEDNFGLSGRLIDMPPLPPPDPKTVRDLEEIARRSKEIADIWGEVDRKWQLLSLKALSAGLPTLRDALAEIDRLLTRIINFKAPDWWALAAKMIPLWGPPIGVPDRPKDNTPRLEGNEYYSPMSYRPGQGQGGGNPLFQRASFTTQELVDQTEKNTDETKALTDQLAKLNAFFDRAGGSTTAGNQAGVMKASYGPEGGGPGFGGGGNAAGAAGIPWAGGGNAGTSPMGRTGEAAAGGQPSADLSRPAYDKMFKGTPLEGKYDNVVAAARANNVPPSLMAGIMAHETSKGTSAMLRDKNNPAGLMDPATGSRSGLSFPNVDAGIEAAGRSIGKNYAAGGGTIEGMAKSYAPPGAANDPGGLNAGWPTGVASAQRQLSTGMEGGTAGVSSATPGTPGDAVDKAMTQLGLSEHKDRRDIQQYLRTGGVGMDPERTAWCAAFVNSSLAQTGIKGSGSNVANSFQRWGQPATGGVQRGDVLVRPQGRGPDQTGGHVGMATGKIDPKTGKIQMLSGNTSDRVGLTWENPDRIIARRAILDRGVVDRANSGGSVNSTGKLDVNVNAPPGTKTSYEGTNLLKNYAMQRQTQMLPTSYGQPDSANLWE